jgi:hypothetical protein
VTFEDHCPDFGEDIRLCLLVSDEWSNGQMPQIGVMVVAFVEVATFLREFISPQRTSSKDNAEFVFREVRILDQTLKLPTDLL